MPDYSACLNVSCKKRSTCARFLMVWGDHQSIAGFNETNCNSYWDVGLSQKPPFKIMNSEEADRVAKTTIKALRKNN